LEALEKKNHYVESGWPHKFIAAYQKSQFRESICHLCRDIPSEIFYCHPMYGSKVKVHYGPYIKRIAVEKNIEEHEAENEIRDILGIPHIGEGWVSERELLNMVKSIFPGNEIVHQASPEWLGRQRLDVFIPELRLAIEYQGRQHYEPVPFFGGEDGFRQTQERDKFKARLCSENGVTVVFFRYDEIITRELVETRIREALNSKQVT
jgi:very-short-patch-repair endonuclease